MSAELLITIGELLLKLGPGFVQDFEAVKAAGSATPAQLATLEAQITQMDGQRMASWAAADAALTQSGG